MSTADDDMMDRLGRPPKVFELGTKVGGFLKEREGDQPLPSTNDEVDCQTRLFNRMSQEIPLRRQVGIERYGNALQPFNGRDSLRDLWEELLDASTYFMQVEAEMTALCQMLQDLVANWNNEGDRAHGERLRAAERLLMELGWYERAGA